MLDHFPVEAVLGETVLARAQGELLGLHEGPQCAELAADRAVAARDIGEIGRRLVAHLAAMAAAGVGSHHSHGLLRMTTPGSYAASGAGQPRLSAAQCPPT